MVFLPAWGGHVRNIDTYSLQVFMNRKLLLSLAIGAFLLTACSPSDQSAELGSYPAYGICTIDSPANGATLDGKADFSLDGWAFNKQNDSVSNAVIVYFVNEETTELITRTATRSPRADVAAAFQKDAVLNSGFNSVISANALQPGIYRIELIQVSNRSGSFRCDGAPHKIIVQ